MEDTGILAIALPGLLLIGVCLLLLPSIFAYRTREGGPAAGVACGLSALAGGLFALAWLLGGAGYALGTGDPAMAGAGDLILALLLGGLGLLVEAYACAAAAGHALRSGHTVVQVALVVGGVVPLVVAISLTLAVFAGVLLPDGPAFAAIPLACATLAAAVTLIYSVWALLRRERGGSGERHVGAG